MTLESRVRVFRFEGFTVDTERRLLLRDGVAVALMSRTFDLLLALIESRDALVTKQDLLARVWPNQFIEEGNLTVHMSALRKALGERRGEHRFVVTVPGRGYRFVAPVREGDDAPLPLPTLAPAPSPVPTRSAWRVSGRTAVVSFAVLIALSLLVFQRARARAEPHAAHRTTMSTRLLTARGDVSSAVLSRDGQYFAYVTFQDGLESLWLGRVSGGTPLQLREPSEDDYEGLAFSATGDRVLYSTNGALWEVPILGGAPRRVLDGLRGGFSVSPDGRQLAFVRRSADRSSSAIVIAELDGSGRERIVASLDAPREFSTNGPGWSPDGTRLAIGITSERDPGQFVLTGVRVADGAMATFGTRQWDVIGRVVWLRDGTGIAFHAVGASSDYHIWLLELASAEFRCVTPDLSRYGRASVSVSDDGASLVALRAEITAMVWVAPTNEVGRARAITSRAFGKLDGSAGLTWTPQDRIVYASFFNNSSSIWTMMPDGRDARPLTTAGSIDRFPLVTRDGRFVVFQSNRGGGNDIWRMDADGAHPRRLTEGGHAEQPTLSPDGKWVYYAIASSGSSSIWKISIDGGTPTIAIGAIARWPSVSPDGRSLAYAESNAGEAGASTRVAIRPIAPGGMTKSFELPRGATANNGLHWAPDGSAVIYRNFGGGLWRQPIVGGAPARMSELPNERIYSFGWASDGKRFAMSYGDEVRDVVLMSGFR